MNRSFLQSCGIFTALLSLLATGIAQAQSPSAQSKPGGTTSAVAGAQYRAGKLKQAFLGENYRHLWTTPVQVETLDPERFAGGLEVEQAGGGFSTESLRLKGADGREYVFRSVDKNITPSLPEDLRGTVAQSVVQDAVSAKHPTAALVTAKLLEAAGVLHAAPRLYVMPDHPFLGEHRERFAGRLGQLEHRPEETEDKVVPGFPGAREVEGTEDFLKELEKDPRNRLDARAYLTARLMDVFLGDWDRHADQWRWARYDGPGEMRIWKPIPRDRDNALVDHKGLLYAVARQRIPQVTKFGPEYDNVFGLVVHAVGLDRRLLSELPRPAWDSVALVLRSRLTDPVIEHALRQLPPEYHRLSADKLARALKGRRDALPGAAAEFYRILTREVDVHATDASETATVDRHPDGSVTVTVESQTEEGDKLPYFSRRFLPDETREVRLFLHGGADRAVIRGAAPQGPLVRIIGGGGDDVLVDSSSVVGPGRRTVLYDHRDDNRFEPGREAKTDARDPVEPARTDTLLMRNPPPPRDWGVQQSWLTPHAAWQSDVGPVLGFGPSWIRYGFRRYPYARATAVRLLWTPLQPDGYGAEVVSDIRWTNSFGRTGIRARATNFEAIRFYGFGNDTPSDSDRDESVVRQTQLLGELLAHVPLRRDGRLMAVAGPVVKWTDPDPAEDAIVLRERPRGTDAFGQAGALAGVRLDLRDSPMMPRTGVRLSADVTGYAWNGGAPFVTLRGTATGYRALPLPLPTVLALRIGGAHAAGDFPFQEAAHVGGFGSLRGYANQRFTGESAAYVGMDLRAPGLFRTKLLVRSNVGAYVFGDAGRVWMDGEENGNVHTAYGGGLLFETMGQVAGLTYAYGDAHRVYLHIGVPF